MQRSRCVSLSPAGRGLMNRPGEGAPARAGQQGAAWPPWARPVAMWHAARGATMMPAVLRRPITRLCPPRRHPGVTPAPPRHDPGAACCEDSCE